MQQLQEAAKDCRALLPLLDLVVLSLSNSREATQSKHINPAVSLSFHPQTNSTRPPLFLYSRKIIRIDLQLSTRGRRMAQYALNLI